MGAKASKNCHRASGVTKDDIDFIVFATLSPDMYFPGGGVQVQELLDMPTIGALDVRNQCSGFIYALSVADQFIKTGMYQNILVIGAENHSGGLEKALQEVEGLLLFLGMERERPYYLERKKKEKEFCLLICILKENTQKS